MILIISERGDPSSLQTIEWLSFFKQEYIHLSDKESIVNFKSLSLSNTDSDSTIEIDGESINLNDVRSYFWRRGFLQYAFKNIDDKIVNTNNEYLNKEISKHLFGEKDKLLKHLYFLLEQTPKKLGTYLNYKENKLDVLYIAQKFGLDIPKTIVTTQKEDLIHFKTECENIISKPIDSSFSIEPETGKNYSHLTSIISDEDINKQEKEFFPTLFQEQIDKKYELRIFYLKSTFYSMAIFSQSNEKTKVDFRNYDKEKPNRTVPFALPKELEKKINLLMSELKLDNGSIDMIVTKDNRYIFLEVNPVGQFGMVSYPCNYYIEKEIAQYLSDINQDDKK